jgi:hypothetical protein
MWRASKYKLIVFLGLTEHASIVSEHREKQKIEERQKSMSTTMLEEEGGRLKATKNEFDI